MIFDNEPELACIITEQILPDVMWQPEITKQEREFLMRDVSQTPEAVRKNLDVYDQLREAGKLPAVDLVIPWVNGHDPTLNASMQQQVHNLEELGRGVLWNSISAKRCISSIEIALAIRTTLRFAPWIRSIFVLINSPSQLSDDCQLTTVKEAFRCPKVIVRSLSEFMPVGYQITHSSTTIEQHLHRLPFLSEWFLYSNDDIFFGRPTEITDFFDIEDVQGVSKIKRGIVRYLDGNTITLSPTSIQWQLAYLNSVEVLKQIQAQSDPAEKAIEIHVPAHTIQPQKRSIHSDPDVKLMIETCVTPARAMFRTPSDIMLTGVVCPGLMTARGLARWKQTEQAEVIELGIPGWGKFSDASLKDPNEILQSGPLTINIQSFGLDGNPDQKRNELTRVLRPWFEAFCEMDVALNDRIGDRTRTPALKDRIRGRGRREP